LIVAVIGEGIFAEWTLWHLAQESFRYQKLKIIQFADPNRKACSDNSTALAAARGNLWGASELGDFLQKSWHYLNYLLEMHQWRHVQKVAIFYAEQSHVMTKNYYKNLPMMTHAHTHERYSYESGLLFLAKSFMDEIRETTKKLFTLQGHDYHCLYARAQDHLTYEGNEWRYENDKVHQLFIAPGAWIVDQPELYHWCGLDIPVGSILHGSYLEGRADLGDFPFSFYGPTVQFYYHGLSKIVLIGTYSSEENESEDIRKKALLEKCLELPLLWQEALKSSSLELKTGQRHKMKKRSIYLGQSKNGCLYALGGYKNGYLAGAYVGQKMATLLEKNLRQKLSL
jgi:hypothetical protein